MIDSTKRITQPLGQFLLIAGVFTVPLTGPAPHNILLGLALILLLVSHNPIKILRSSWQPHTLKTPLLLFGWLTLSLLWSGAALPQALDSLAKYQELLLIPLFVYYLRSEACWRRVAIALYAALALAMIASFLIHYDLANLTHNEHSLRNRIFHGVCMSMLGYLSLRLAARATGLKRLLFLLVFAGAAYSVFIIENGRTGYLTFLLITLVALLQTLTRRQALLFGVLPMLLGVAALLLFLPEQLRIFNDPAATHEVATSLWQKARQIDIRAEYYLYSAQILANHWLIGAGVGAFPQLYADFYAANGGYWGVTDNPHNEFLILGIQGGILAIALFTGWLVQLALQTGRETLAPAGSYLAMAVLVAIACCFNSSFLDHSDGFLFAIAIALLIAQPTAASTPSTPRGPEACSP